jgi:phosphate transport system substrate-binding protein
MFGHQRSPGFLGKQLLWMLATPAVFGIVFAFASNRLLWAQTPNPLEGVEIPTTLPAGTELTIESSDAMRQVNDALQSRFAEQYEGTEIDINYQDSATAVQALLAGDADLAAIGRSLLDAETAQGLTEVPLARRKIAIITSPENPFNGSLTVEQFAQIFRGEITNWSEVGGPDAEIVLVDRPVVSDTRQAFQSYPAFQNAPFETGANAVTLDQDSTEAVIQELGPNALGYAVAEQVLNNPNVKLVPMHDTLPDNQAYPFSQPLSYVYSQQNASPEALAYLGYATNPNNEAVIEAARAATADATATTETDATAEAETTSGEETDATAEEAAVSEAAASGEAAEEIEEMEAAASVAAEEATVETTEAVGRTRGVPWWPWILALPVLGGLLWWLLRNQAPIAAAPVVAESRRRVILTPRNCRDAYAYWELPTEEVDALRRQHCSLALRLHDVTGIDKVDQQPPHSMKPFDCDTVATGDKHLPVAVDDRDYLVELGYVGTDNNWHALARSERVRVPACTGSVPHRVAGVGAAAGAAAGAAGLTAAAVAAKPKVVSDPARVVMTPLNAEDVYAYWELPKQQVEDLRHNNRALKARLYDTTQGSDNLTTGPNSMQEFDCELTPQGDLHMPIAVDNRDYSMELGYADSDGRWRPLAKSESVHVPARPVPLSPHPLPNDTPTTPAAAAAAANLKGITGNLKTITPNLDNSLPAKTANLASTVGQTTTSLADGAGRLAGAGVAGGAAVAAGVGATAQNWRNRAQPQSPEPKAQHGIGLRTDLGAESRIILVPRSQDAAYAYWEAAQIHKDALIQQGGQTMALRIHDATDLDIDYQPPHDTQEYPCNEAAQDMHVPIPTPDRDYVAELGYRTADGQWLRLIRSLHVRVPDGSKA